jgi:esterase FrsA
MHDVDELKQFATPHARVQGVPADRCRELLDRVHTDEDGGPGSWVGEWSAAGRELERAGRPLEACAYYNLARFPYVDGVERAHAMRSCTEAFDRWRREHTDFRRLDVDLDDGQVRCWLGSGASPDRPLLVVMGGIVSVKEQWAALLAQARRLGTTVLVAEMPGVGENTAPYDAASHRMFSRILDAAAGQADVTRTYAMALSFSGHLALRCAVDDHRIRGILTIGAPVREFFTNDTWRDRVPRLTVATLAHLAGVEPAKVSDHMRGWGLQDDQLAALDIPVHYLASLRDEIIPGGEVALLRRHVRHLRLVEKDDVHGSPNHQAEIRLWTATSALQMLGGHPVRRMALGALLRLTRARERRAGS